MAWIGRNADINDGSPQSYYVTHTSSIVDYEEDYQGKLQGDSQDDKHHNTMNVNKSLRTSSNTRNQAVIQDGRVDIQTKNAGFGGNDNRNAGRQNMNQAFNAGNENDESNPIVQRVS
ncbi:hypothetical protein Tco_0368647 [Tanacetum coccineum]